ncbi:hypothetical protein BH09MYX1_BH09MYX1_46250 [soil metagenome]
MVALAAVPALVVALGEPSTSGTFESLHPSTSHAAITARTTIDRLTFAIIYGSRNIVLCCAR